MRRLCLLGACLAMPLAAGAQDMAASFPGLLDHVLVGPLDPGASFTVETWVELGLTGAETLVCAADDDYFNAFCVQYRDDHWVVEIEDDDEFEADTCDETHPHLCVDDDQSSDPGPVHVAVTVSPSRMSLFLDGAEVATADADGPVDWIDNEWALGIDAEPEISVDEPAGWNNDSLDGLLDEVRVWDHVRTAEELLCLRDWALTGAESGLIALWRFDTESGGVTPDGTGGGHDGTLMGTTELVPSVFGLVPSLGGDIGCLDFDEDGWTPDEGDCDDLDPQRFPGAEEVRDDGIDQDCDGFDQTTRLRGGLAECGCAATSPAASGWGWALVLLAVGLRRRQEARTRRRGCRGPGREGWRRRCAGGSRPGRRPRSGGRP